MPRCGRVSGCSQGRLSRPAAHSYSSIILHTIQVPHTFAHPHPSTNCVAGSIRCSIEPVSPRSWSAYHYSLSSEAFHRSTSHDASPWLGKRHSFNMAVTPIDKGSSGDAVSMVTPLYPCSFALPLSPNMLFALLALRTARDHFYTPSLSTIRL